MLRFKNSLYSLVCFTSLLLFSCARTKNVTYFTDVTDTIVNKTVELNTRNFSDPKIRVQDVLQVSIQTLDPQTNSLIGGSVTSTGFSGAAGAGVPSGSGFLVDHDGNIEMPLVGKVHVAGLTTSEAKEAIRTKAAVYYKEPVINVRISNFVITVLGEVNRPGAYTIGNERVTILDAIGLAGDLTIYGKRQNVLLVRDSMGIKKMSRFDLTSSKTFASPYFYLRQGDMIYIEPNKAKVATNDMAQVRNLSILTAAVSMITIVISRINFN